MSSVSISLSANTANYVKRLKEAKTQTDRNIILMEKRIDSFARQVNSDFTSINGAINSMMGGLSKLKGGGYIAAIVGLGAAGLTVASKIQQMNMQLLQSEIALKKAATQARMTTSEVQNYGAVVGTVGISLEQFGQISNDVFDKLGDYITTGGGAFQDFVDAVGRDSKVTAESLQSMTSIDALSAMVAEMERVGVSSAQITFVMESIASESSSLIPLLENGAAGFKRLKERIDEINSTPLMLGQTAEEISLLDVAAARFWDNFALYAAESTAGATSVLVDFFTWANNKLARINKDHREEKFLEDYYSGQHTIDSDIPSWEAKERAAILEASTVGKSHAEKLEEAKERLFSARESAKFSTSSMAFADIFNAERAVEALENMTKEEIRQHDLKLSRMKEVARQYYEIAKAKEAIGKSGGVASSANLSKIRSTPLTGSDSELDELHKTHTNRVKDLSSKIEKTKSEINDINKQLEAEKAIAVDKVLEEQLKAKQNQLKGEQEQLKAHKEQLLKIEAESAKRKKEAEDKAAREAQQAKEASWKKEVDAATHRVNLAKEGEEKILAQQELNQIKYRQMLEKGLIDKATFDAYKLQNEAKTQQALDNLVFQGELNRLRIATETAITSSEKNQANYDLEIAQLKERLAQKQITQEHYDNLALQAKFAQHQAEFQADEDKFTNEHYAEIARNELEMQFWQEALTNKQITQAQFDELELEAKQRITNAKRELTLSELDTMAAAMSGMSSLAKEGSEAQKALFLAEKSATLASLGIKMWDAWGAVDKDPTLTTQASKIAAKAGVIAQYTAAMGSVAGAAIGQFHSGTDEVDSTGSYILKQGERVVQPEANKDLTAFLSNNKQSHTSEIKADLVIQGDTTISDEKFQAMLFQHRENLTAAIRTAQRENPSLR